MSFLQCTVRTVLIAFLWRKHLSGTSFFWDALSNPEYRAVKTAQAPKWLRDLYS